MNKRIDLTNLGGFPLEQDTLDFMQQSYRGAFGALAKLCGDKVILTGVEVAGGNVSSGWIVYNGELIPFIGGSVAAKVLITETAVQATFEDTNVYDAYFTKSATCGTSGDFDFSELVPLLTLQNIWLPGDIKEKLVDNTYIATNFDSSGYGINMEIGWRILSKAYPSTAGKVMVNQDTSDPTFDTVGNTGGTKTGTIVQNQLPASMVLKIPLVQHTSSAGTFGVTDGPLATGSTPTDITVTNPGGGQSFNKLQPYYVILKTIKL